MEYYGEMKKCEELCLIEVLAASDNNYMHCPQICIYYCDGTNLKILKIKTLNFDSPVRVMKTVKINRTINICKQFCSFEMF